MHLSQIKYYNADATKMSMVLAEIQRMKVECHQSLVVISQNGQDDRAAIVMATEALEFDLDESERATFLALKAKSHNTLEEFEKAAEDFEKAVELQKNILASKEDIEEQRAEQSKLKGLARQLELNKRLALTKVSKLPVTILTGFLGSGKTTLLNRILSEKHGKRIAVIENEYGSVAVDDKLIEQKQHVEETVIETVNGCICCSTREDLTKAMLGMKDKYIDSGKIDYVIIEATGMAAMGQLMGKLKPQLQGRADMGEVSQRVKAKLGT